MRRIRQLLAANVHSVLDRADDPEKMLRALLHEMDEARGDGRRALEAFGRDRQRLQKDLEAREREARRWQARAEQALKEGDDARAREAVARRHDAQAESEKVRKALDQLVDAESQLKADLNRLEERREAAVGRCRTLAGQRRERRVAERYASPADACLARSGERWERIHSRLDRIEARIEAYDMGAAEQAPPADDEIDRELSSMKQRIQC